MVKSQGFQMNWRTIEFLFIAADGELPVPSENGHRTVMNSASGVLSVSQQTDLFIFLLKKRKKKEAQSLLPSPLQLCLGALFSGELLSTPATSNQLLLRQPPQQIRGGRCGTDFIMHTNKQTK